MIPFQQLIQRNAFAQDDESDTDTEQRLGQKNLGSGESDNFNCAENMITSANGIDCIPSGPAPPTPPPPAITFAVTGFGDGGFLCEGAELAIASFTMNTEVGEDGTATGTVLVTFDSGSEVSLTVTGGTTDGSTFSLSGPAGICSDGGTFTISGSCGNRVEVTYVDPTGTGSFVSDTGCTLL